MVALGAACSSSDAVELKPGTTVVYQRTLNTNIGQTESMGALDMARDGRDIVVLIAYGYRTFTEHPGLPGDPSTGSSTTSGGYILAVSRDDGATFTLSPLYATSDVTGEPLGVHLNAGRAWMVMLSDGPVDSRPLRMHALDLDSATLASASAGQGFRSLSGGASSVALVGDRMIRNASEHLNTYTNGGTWGFEELSLSTGAFSDRTIPLGMADPYDSCTTTLYATDDGQAWEGYRECGSIMCRFTTELANGRPAVTCVPRAEWPGPADQLALAVTGAGVVQVYSRDGQSFAARMRGTTAVELPLGAGEVFFSLYFRPSPGLRLPYGPLVPVGPVEPTGRPRMVALASSGAAFDVPIPTPCVDDDSCPAAITRVLPLGGDDYLVLHTAQLEGDRSTLTLLLRRDTAVRVPVTGGGGPAPVPGCPTAIAATPVVSACALAVACFPGLDVRNCIREWTTIANGPTQASFDRFVATTDCAGMQAGYPRAARAFAASCTPGCVGTTAVQSCSTTGGQHSVIDCAAVGMTCGNTGPNGIGCHDSQPATCGTCDAQGRAVSCPDGKPEVVNCAAFGTVCSTAVGQARCIDSA